VPNIAAEPLESFARNLLLQGGVAESDAAVIAKSLVGANLRGYDSHGVMRLPFYLDMLAAGDTVGGADLRVLQESGTLLAASANWGFGVVQCHRLLGRLIEKARESGVGLGTLLEASHVGRLGEYCERAAEEGFVSIFMANTHGAARRVAPPGGKSPRLGTNPIAIGAPCGDAPLVLDFSTSATAEGKVRVKKIAGERTPDGWLIDNQGRPTNDPNDLYADPPGSILPMGGDQAYKGFGLGLMIDIFTGALSGGLCSRETPETPKGNCVFMMVVDPARLGGADAFAKEVTGLAKFVRDCPRIDSEQEILLPGDPERRTMQRLLREGVTLDEGNWGQLLELAERLGVSAPA